MELLLFLTLFTLTSSQFSLILLSSELTPASELTSFDSNIFGRVEEVKNTFNFSQPVQILTHSVNTNTYPWDLNSILLTATNPIIYDLTYNLMYSQYISKTCLDLNILHIVLNRPLSVHYNELETSNTLYTNFSYTEKANLLYSVVEKFGWTNLGVIHDDSPNRMHMGDVLKSLIQAPKVLRTETIFTARDSYDQILAEMFSNVKQTSAKVIFVLTSSQIASLIIKAADELGISGAGYVWILGADAMADMGQILVNDYAVSGKNIMNTGIVGIMPADESFVTLDYFSATLAGIVMCLQSLKSPSGSQLYTYLSNGVVFNGKYPNLQFDSDGLIVTNFALYNIQNFRYVQVGYYKNEILFLAPNTNIFWPGGGSPIPTDEFITLLLVLIHPGSDNSEDQNIQNGFNLAIKQINQDKTLLPGYILESIYIQPYSVSEVIPGSLGFLDSINVVGFVGPWGDELSASYASYIQALANPKPLVSYQASSYVLNNSVEFPYFLRTVQPDGLSATALTIFLDFMKWKKIGVVYTDDETGLGMYYSLLENIKSYDITIGNTEELRKIEVGFTSLGTVTQSTLDSIDETLSDLVKNQLKVIVYLGGNEITSELVNAIHGKQLFGGDYFWIGTNWLDSATIAALNSSVALSTIQGFMTLGFRPPIGPVGNSFQNMYNLSFNTQPSAYSMLAYDSVYLYAYSIQAMIEAGEDFYQVDSLMNFLRTADFLAASGNLKFSDGFNDRVLVGYSLLNVQGDNLVAVKVYDPVTSYTDNPGTSIWWPDNVTITPPDSWGYTFDCPFPKPMSMTSENGLIIIIMIGIGLVLLAFAISLAHYNRSRKLIFEKLEIKTSKTWKDTMVEIMILVEFFQFIAIAPPFESLSLFIVILSNIFMLDLLKIADARSNYYWFMLSAVCGLCFVWFVLMIYVILKKKKKSVAQVPILQKCLDLLITFFLPFFGNTLFLPTLAFLLDAFVCDHKVLGKDYVWRDCYMVCWTGEHVQYVVLSAFAIILYEPLAIICRPFWQEASKDMHLKVTTTFLLFKTCFQILLITVGKALQANFPVAHGITFSILVAIFTVSTYKFSAFNYSRCNLWELASLGCLTYYSILATLSFVGDTTNFGWVLGLIFGWIVIIGITYGIQWKYYPPLLYTEEQPKESGKVRDMDEVAPSLGLGVKVEDDKVLNVSRCDYEDDAGNVQVTKKFMEKAESDSN